MTRLHPAAALGFARAVLAEAGYSPEDAELCADSLLDASLRGVDTHGIEVLLSDYVRCAARYDPAAEPRLSVEGGSTAVLDARGTLGVRAARFALAHAMTAARAHGVAAVAVRNIGYVGALGFLVRPAAEAGLVALGVVNGGPHAVPAGGLDPLHGTNPIAAAIPHRPEPLVIDTRTNELRMADYRDALRHGTELPPGSLVMPDGRETTDPADAGAAGYLPMAGGRGFALALLVDVLAAALSGAPIGREVGRDGELEGRLGAFFLVLDPARFDPSFAASVERLAAQVHETRPADPSRPVRLPGERGASARRRRREEGIPVDPGAWGEMGTRLRELGISVEPPELEPEGET